MNLFAFDTKFGMQFALENSATRMFKKHMARNWFGGKKSVM